MSTGTVFDIARDSYVDGPGIRTTVFFKGCNLKCLWCHNPESQSFAPQMMYYHNKCTECGKCVEKCTHNAANTPENCILCGNCALYCPNSARKICGKSMSADEVFAEISGDKPFFETSGGGVTFSGGECMLQLNFLRECLKKCHEGGINTAVDTAGLLPFESFEAIFPYTDLFLYDLKAIDPEVHIRLTGADNTQILRNLEKLLNSGKRVWVRIPVIPGANENEIPAIAKFLKNLPSPEKTELLPYHEMGIGKYEALGRQTMHFSVPDESRMEEYRRLFIK